MAWPVNSRTSAMMDEAQSLYGATITATQGSPNVGVGASFGTHDGEGVIDVVGADLDAIVIAMRRVGFAAWHRTVAEGFTPHVHGVAVGEPLLSPAAADQVTDYFEGRNGLATNAPDDGPRDWVGITWEDYLAGNPAPGGTRVFRGVQLGLDDVIVTSGSLDPYDDIYDALAYRSDGDTVTVTAGDEFYVYLTSGEFYSTDVLSQINWRFNASGHGTLALAESYDLAYSYTPPFDWTSLGNVVVDSDTFALTATPALPHTAVSLDGNDGSILLRVTVVSGTVTLDWLVLQVEPPAGLLITSGSHWSPWFTPDLVPHSPPYAQSLYRHADISSLGTWPSESDKQDAVDAAVASAVGAYTAAGDTTGSLITIPPTSSAYQITAGARISVQEHPHLSGQEVIVQLHRDDGSVDWGSFPDYRTQPLEIDGLYLSGEIALDPDTGTPEYEFAEGDTVSVRWHPAPINFEYHGDEQDDGATGTVNALLTLDQSSPASGASITWTPTAGVAASIQILCSYFDGIVTFGPPNTTGGATSWTATDVLVSRLWLAFVEMAIDVQMPDFRYLVNEWTRSPDALDTTDPEGVIVTWLRQRQRNDGLGNSITRARGASSRQMSLRQRGYR